MADVITLTAQPIRVTAIANQPLWVVRDVLAYDVLDLEIGVVGFEGPGPYSVTIRTWTSLQCENEEEWGIAGSDSTITTVNTFQEKSIHGGFLRYLRWGVVLLGANTTAVTFFIRGMARTYLETTNPKGQY